MVPEASITQLLKESRNGNVDAMERLVPFVYRQLHTMAARYMRAERPDHTLSPTALLNEAYLRLIDVDVPWEDRSHFFCIAARTMRRILVDHANSRRRLKRAGQAQRVNLEDVDLADPGSATAILELDEGLTHLAAHDARMAQVVELSFFGGLTYDEVARTLNISPATVHRELRMAKAWLQSALARSTKA